MTLVFCEGLLEPFDLDEPMATSAMNMSAAMNHQMMFFRGKLKEGGHAMIAIPKVIALTSDDDD